MIDTEPRNDMQQVTLRSALLAVLGVAALSGLAPGPLTAQVARAPSAGARPQPRFTRIFGSDSMDIGMPVLSPDGRWVVVIRSQGSDTINLWVVPASGGAPIQLTSGRHMDLYPKWFPSGDRIAFVSDRPSPPGQDQWYVMTIPFDTQTGRTTGPAQQVSLEQGYDVAVSPDGRWILFETAGLPGTRRLMVVPSTGGTARTVVRTDGFNSHPQWSPDGREIYYLDMVRGAPGRTLMRVSAEGGQPQRMFTAPRLWVLTTATRQVLTLSDVSRSGSRVTQVLTFEGRTVASVPLHRNMFPWSFTGGGHSLIAVVSDVVAPIRVAPVAGGPSRNLTQAREYDELDAWTADASRLAVRTRTNGHATLLDVPIDGGQATEIATPPEAMRTMLSPDRNHLFYVVSDSATSRKSLWVRRLSDGRTREIAPYLSQNPRNSIAGPGGSPYSGEEMLYFERRGDRLELRACAPEGAPRLLRSFPASFMDRSTVGGGFGVHGERIAWTDEVGDSTALVLAEGRNGASRRVAVVHGRLSSPVWSPDGRWIAATYFELGEKVHLVVFVVGVTPGSQPSALPRLVDAGLVDGWGIKWLPDSRAVTVLGMSGQSSKYGIWLISLREGDPPVNLTRDDPSNMEDYSLSPDGRYIAYPAEIPRGSSIWRIDLQP
jgi:Tol biopolymer transport system component